MVRLAGPRALLLSTLIVASVAAAPAGGQEGHRSGSSATSAISLPSPSEAPAPPASASPEHLLALARQRLAAGDVEGAIAVLEPLAGRDPAEAPDAALAFLAGLYLEVGRPEDALAVLEPRIPDRDSSAPGIAGVGPEPAELLFMAARAAQALAREEAAEQYLERSAAAAPLSRAAVLLATVRSQEERHAEAERLLAPFVHPETFATVRQRDPAFAAEIALHYARTLLAQDRPAEAVPPLQQAVELRPDDPDVLHRLAAALVDAGRLEEGRDVLARELALRDEARRRADS